MLFSSFGARNHGVVLGKWALGAVGALLASTLLSSTAVFGDSETRAVQEFPLPTSNPIGITSDPHAGVWFTTGDAKLGRILSSGKITEFDIPGPPPPCPGCPPPSRGQEITRGPDGNLWITQPFANLIGRVQILADGISVTEYSPPSPCSRPPRFCLDGITAGPDGNIWFTEPTRNRIGRLSLSTFTITEFSISPGSFPLRITPGPDGNLWFANAGNNSVGRITTAGFSTEFPVPNPELANGGGAAKNPDPDPDSAGDPNTNDFYGYTVNSGTTAAGDGNIWLEVEAGWGDSGTACPTTLGNDDPCNGFVSYPTSDWLVAVRPSDGVVVKQFPIAVGSNVQDMTVDRDGNVWFAEAGSVDAAGVQQAGMQVGRLTPSGELTEFVTPTPFSRPFDITSSSRGEVWFTEVGRIGRIKPCDGEGSDCKGG
jgi:virginiamycin B lyase